MEELSQTEKKLLDFLVDALDNCKTITDYQVVVLGFGLGLVGSLSKQDPHMIVDSIETAKQTLTKLAKSLQKTT